MPTSPTVKTVAEAAGVSPATVSNAYNRPERLSAGLRARILAIAEEQGYPGPDPVARSLRTRRSGAIGVIFTTGLSRAFADPYLVTMLGGLSEVAEASGTGLVLVPAAVEAVQRAAIDGAVAYWLDDGHPVVRLLAARGIPLVRSADTATGPCVTIDDTAAGRSIGRHLAGLGHRDVAVLVSDPDLPYSRLRLAGIRAGLGAGARIRMVTAAGPLLNGTDRPSAIAADSDVLALGVLDAVRSHGLRPGRDLSVTGFDGVPAAQAAGLTTVRQPIRETGRLMGRMLLDPGFTERRVILPTELVVGASTGPAPDRSVR